MSIDGRPAFTIAHISDLHCGDPSFQPSLLERAISEINELEPLAVVCTGDLTVFGFKEEYRLARERAYPTRCLNSAPTNSTNARTFFDWWRLFW